MKQTINSGASLATAAVAIVRQGAARSTGKQRGRAIYRGKVTCGGCLQFSR
jgi:hypothetical protein